MLPALHDEARRALIGFALLACASSASLLPLTATSSPEASAQTIVAGSEVRVSSLPEREEYQPFTIARDPFVPDASAEERGDVRDVSATAASGDLPIVRAVILGPQSRALVETGGAVRVFGLGDRLAGATIVAIDRNGLRLADGRQLRIAGGS